MKLIRKSILSVLVSAVAMLSCGQKDDTSKAASSFVKVENGLFVCEDYPSHFIGTNFWYGAILGSEGMGGDRVRLEAELDTLRLFRKSQVSIMTRFSVAWTTFSPKWPREA